MATIIVIDDDAGTRETFSEILQADGHLVWSAENGSQGLCFCDHLQPDLVLADLRLPDMTALEVLTELRLVGLSVPFVIITGFGSTDLALEAGRRGANGFIDKPVFEDDLLKLVDARTQSVPRAQSRSFQTTRAAHRHALRVLELVEARYTDSRFTIRSVADELRISVPHLCRALKAETHVSFVTLLRHARIRGAKRLLRSTSLSQKEISTRVGFASAGHFDRVFKALCRVSPTEYRAATRLMQFLSKSHN